MSTDLSAANSYYTGADQGWAWVVLIVCFFLEFLTFGSMKCFGVLFNELVEYYRVSEGKASWIPTIANFVSFSVAILLKYISDPPPYRLISILGGILISLGYLCSAFASQIGILFFTYGILTGIGLGCTSSMATILVSIHFDKRRGLALGIMFAGSGVGSFVLPLLYRWLIESLGIRKTFIALAGLMVSIIGMSFVLKPPTLTCDKNKNISPESRSMHQSITEKEETLNNTCSVCWCVPEVTLRKRWNSRLGCYLLKIPSFCLFLISVFFASLSQLPTLVVILAHMADLGLKSQEAFIVLALGVGDIFGRIAIGWFSDLGAIPIYWIYAVLLTLNGVASLCVPLSYTSWMMLVYSLVFTLTMGGFLSLIFPMCVDRIGIGNITYSVGMVSLQFALGSLFGQPAAGWLRDLTGSWDASFYFTGTASLTAAAIVLFETLYNKNSSRQVKHDATDMENTHKDAKNNSKDIVTNKATGLSSCTCGRYMEDDKMRLVKIQRFKGYNSICDPDK